MWKVLVTNAVFSWYVYGEYQATFTYRTWRVNVDLSKSKLNFNKRQGFMETRMFWWILPIGGHAYQTSSRVPDLNVTIEKCDLLSDAIKI